MLDFFLSIIAAASLSGAEPADPITATCELAADGNRRRTTTLSATCEALDNADDTAALQSAANRLIDRIALPLNAGPTALPSTITLQRLEHGWDLERAITLVPVSYGPRRVRGILYIDCMGKGTIVPDGSLTDVNWRCARMRWGESAEDDPRHADHFANQMQQGRWLLPLRFEEGCAEVGFSQRHSFPGGNAVLAADDRPRCYETPYAATQSSHQPMLPINISASGYGARCQAHYTYDADGFIHDVTSDCQLLEGDTAIEEPYSPSQTIVRDAYNGAIILGVERMRIAPTSPEFEGVREGSRRIVFEMNIR